MCMSLLRNETNRMITHKVTMSQEAYNKLQTLHYSNVGLGDEPFFWTGGGEGVKEGVVEGWFVDGRVVGTFLRPQFLPSALSCIVSG